MIKKRISLQKSLFTKEFKFTHFRIHSELHKNIFIVHLSIYALLSKSKIDPFYHRQSYFPLSLYMQIFTFTFCTTEIHITKLDPLSTFFHFRFSISHSTFTFHTIQMHIQRIKLPCLPRSSSWSGLSQSLQYYAQPDDDEDNVNDFTKVFANF